MASITDILIIIITMIRTIRITTGDWVLAARTTGDVVTDIMAIVIVAIEEVIAVGIEVVDIGVAAEAVDVEVVDVEVVVVEGDEDVMGIAPFYAVALSVEQIAVDEIRPGVHLSRGIQAPAVANDLIAAFDCHLQPQLIRITGTLGQLMAYT